MNYNNLKENDYIAFTFKGGRVIGRITETDMETGMKRIVVDCGKSEILMFTNFANNGYSLFRAMNMAEVDPTVQRLMVVEGDKIVSGSEKEYITVVDCSPHNFAGLKYFGTKKERTYCNSYSYVEAYHDGWRKVEQKPERTLDDVLASLPEADREIVKGKLK